MPNSAIAEFAFLRNPFRCIPVEHSCLKTGMTQFLRNNMPQEFQFWQGPLPKIKGLAVQVSNSGHAIDLFGGRLDQVGLLEMRSLPNPTNGVVYPVIVCFGNFLSLLSRYHYPTSTMTWTCSYSFFSHVYRKSLRNSEQRIFNYVNL